MRVFVNSIEDAFMRVAVLYAQTWHMRPHPVDQREAGFAGFGAVHLAFAFPARVLVALAWFDLVSAFATTMLDPRRSNLRSVEVNAKVAVAGHEIFLPHALQMLLANSSSSYSTSHSQYGAKMKSSSVSESHISSSGVRSGSIMVMLAGAARKGLYAYPKSC
jgi:hypothetical protein